MSSFKYEFLTYESFPDDQYVKEIVTVMINDAVILPYQHVQMKDGGSFWTFPGSQAQKNGVKKRINAEFESKRAKLSFENALEAFVAKKTGIGVVGQVSCDASVATPPNDSLAYPNDPTPPSDAGFPF